MQHHALVDIAIAENIYFWKYRPTEGNKCFCYETPEGSILGLVSWSHFLDEAIDLLNYVTHRFKLMATIKAPFRPDGAWYVEFRSWDELDLYSNHGMTLQEAISRASLSVVGIEVDDR